MSNTIAQTIGGGLLRLLADTLALHAISRNQCWETIGAADKTIHDTVCADYREMAATADLIATRIVCCGVTIPKHSSALMRLSSIEADIDDAGAWETPNQLLNGHRQVLADIATLQVALPLADDSESAKLLEDLAEKHRQIVERLSVLLQTSPSTH